MSWQKILEAVYNHDGEEYKEGIFFYALHTAEQWDFTTCNVDHVKPDLMQTMSLLHWCKKFATDYFLFHSW